MELLGKGGFGEVVALDADRVAKIQKSSKEYDPGVSCALLREILAMSIVDGGARLGRVMLEGDGTCAMEIRRYDETLLEFIRRNRGNENMAERLSIFSDIVYELHTVHRMSIAHRDLKPENIMLKKGRAHIIDWGMSRLMTSGGILEKEWNSWTPGVTTVWYRAPELFTGDEYGLSVDIWSLGILLIELITGVCPFRGRTEVLQIREYIEVLGLPTKGALKQWPYNEVALGAEPRRIDLWNVMPAIARVHGLAEIIDGMVRWDMRERMTTEQLIISIKALWGRKRGAQAIGALFPREFPFPQLPRFRFRGSKVTKKALRSIIFPLCVRWRLNSTVLWAAMFIFDRVDLCSEFKSKSQFTLNVIACLDLANKLVGFESSSVLRKLNIQDATHAQVNIVNHCIGIQNLQSVVFNCPPILINTHSLFAPVFIDALIFTKTWRDINPSQWRGLGPTLQHLSRFVSLGQMVHFRRFLKSITLPKRLWRKLASVFANALDQPGPLRAAHPRIFRLIHKDTSVKHRLEFILST